MVERTRNLAIAILPFVLFMAALFMAGLRVGAHREAEHFAQVQEVGIVHATPQVPKVFSTWLASLKGPDAQAMYRMAVSAAPANGVSLAIQDATQSEGNDDYGSK